MSPEFLTYRLLMINLGVNPQSTAIELDSESITWFSIDLFELRAISNFQKKGQNLDNFNGFAANKFAFCFISSSSSSLHPIKMIFFSLENVNKPQ